MVVSEAINGLSKVDSEKALNKASKLEQTPSVKMRLAIADLYLQYGSMDQYSFESQLMESNIALHEGRKFKC